MNRVPNKLRGGGAIQDAINRLIDCVVECQPRQSKDMLLESGPLGFISKPRISGGGGGKSEIFTIYKSGATWLDFKVTTGYVITTAAPIIPDNVETAFALTSGVEFYYFYIDFTSTPTILTSATALTWSALLVPIGWVDTNTYSADSRSVIHQRQHIFNPCV